MLAVNRWRCPLTPVAARFTDDRSDDADCLLPRWVVRHDKVIFGGLYVGSPLELAASRAGRPW